jgi:hypothetical protein
VIDRLRPPHGDGPARAAQLERLRAMLRRLGTEPPRRRFAPRAGDLALEPVDTPHGPALRRVEDVPLPPALAAALAPLADRDGEGTVFLDTETTGLAGGTGTTSSSSAWRPGRRRAAAQYFLGDLAARAAFPAAVRRRWREPPARHVQRPHLRPAAARDRYLLARAWWGADVAHLDLYPMARALWRARVADCRLTTLEAALLELDRGDDLPGAMMPQLYFRYLRSADTRALPRIFAHNRWDLLALAALAARAESLLAGPDPRHDPLEWLGAARWHRRGRPRAPASTGGPRAPLSASSRGRAAWRLGRLWRRAGRQPGAGALAGGHGEDPAAFALLVDLASSSARPTTRPTAPPGALAQVEGSAPEMRALAATLAHRARASSAARPWAPTWSHRAAGRDDVGQVLTGRAGSRG